MTGWVSARILADLPVRAAGRVRGLWQFPPTSRKSEPPGQIRGGRSMVERCLSIRGQQYRRRIATCSLRELLRCCVESIKASGRLTRTGSQMQCHVCEAVVVVDEPVLGAGSSVRPRIRQVNLRIGEHAGDRLSFASASPAEPQEEGHRRRRTINPDQYLAPAQRPGNRVHRSWPRSLRPAPRHPTRGPIPRPPTPGPRLPSHPATGRLTLIPQPLESGYAGRLRPAYSPSIFGSAHIPWRAPVHG